jgi:hypothetical protein
MFSMVTVASSTKMPTASASPPRVMMLMVCPSAPNVMIDVRMESGIETAMMSVLRQLPKNSRNHGSRQASGDQSFPQHAQDGSPHEYRLIGQKPDFQLGWQGLGNDR